MGSRRVGLLTELFFYCTIFLEYSWGKLTEVDVLIICGFAEVLCLLCVFSIEARKLKNTLLSSTNYESCWHVASASSHGFWHVIIFGPHFWHRYLLRKIKRRQTLCFEGKGCFLILYRHFLNTPQSKRHFFIFFLLRITTVVVFGLANLGPLSVTTVDSHRFGTNFESVSHR